MTRAKEEETVQTGDAAETTLLLRRAGAGDEEARNRVWTRLYDEVLLVAGAQRSRWSGDWTLETRVLANEVFIKLFGRTPPSPNDRKHFLTLLSKAVRQILVNYSQAKSTAKRGGGVGPATWNEELEIGLEPAVSEEILALHEALERFAALDQRAAQVVELRFFTGLSYDEIAETLGISKATAVRDWETARAWLNLALDDSVDAEPGTIQQPDENE